MEVKQRSPNLPTQRQPLTSRLETVAITTNRTEQWADLSNLVIPVLLYSIWAAQLEARRVAQSHKPESNSRA